MSKCTTCRHDGCQALYPSGCTGCGDGEYLNYEARQDIGNTCAFTVVDERASKLEIERLQAMINTGAVTLPHNPIEEVEGITPRKIDVLLRCLPKSRFRDALVAEYVALEDEVKLLRKNREASKRD